MDWPDLSGIPMTAWLVWMAVMGLVIGSFLNVVIHRVPRMLEQVWRQSALEILHPEQASETASRVESLAWPGSACPQCGHRLRAWENIPLLSFLWLRGACSQCTARISWQYPLVEGLTALLFVLALWHFGPNLTGLFALGFLAMLVALAGIDARTTLLPDSLTLPLLWAGLLANSLGLFTDLQSAVIGAMAGYLVLWTLYHVFRLLTGREGMGYGDFKLLAALGAWLGWQALPAVLVLAAGVGTIVGIVLILRGRRRETPIPFGPYLAAAGALALFAHEFAVGLYL